MLAEIEALVALEKFGTMSEAAVRLRLTQSAVTKRVHALQKNLGVQLLERDGRRVRLTREAIDLLERARPLVASLRELAEPARSLTAPITFSLAMADSIASSWGPRVLRKALQNLADISVDLHAHRSVLIVESIRLGRYQLGLTSELPGTKDLIHHPIAVEPLVLVHAGLARRAHKELPLISIEPTSATWRAIEPLIRAHHPALLKRKLVPVESFGAALQMVKAGFGDGLLPLGMVLEAEVSGNYYRALPAISRHISLLTRKTVHQLPQFERLAEQLSRAAKSYF